MIAYTVTCTFLNETLAAQWVAWLMLLVMILSIYFQSVTGIKKKKKSSSSSSSSSSYNSDRDEK